MHSRVIAMVAAVAGGLAVVLGAFGAHALEAAMADWGLGVQERKDRLATWEIAVRYQMYHALALFVVAWLAAGRAGRLPAAAAGLWIAGMVVFSGCLYAYVLTGTGFWGAIVPLGGAALILGWAVAAVAIWRSPRLDP